MIDIRNMVKTFNKGKENELTVLKKLNFSHKKGEMLCLMGRSGEGKSTLMNIIAGIESFDSGEYFLDGEDISKYNDNAFSELRNRCFGIVRQDFALVEQYSVYENVVMPLYVAGKNGKNRKAAVNNALEMVGISELAAKEVRKLSGGQKQRTAIARALVNDPAIILADEPTGALDADTSAEIMELIRSINKEGKTVLIVSHDPLVAACCERVAKLENGKISDVQLNVNNSF